MLAVALVAAALGLGTVADAGAQPARRGCYDCHTAAKTAYKKALVHDPVVREDCEACHKRHGFAQKLVLQTPNPICA